MIRLTGRRARVGLVLALAATAFAAAAFADSDDAASAESAERARLVAAVLAAPGDGSREDVEARGSRLAQFGTAVLAPLAAAARDGQVRAGGVTRRFGATESAVALRCVSCLEPAVATDVLVSIARAAPDDRTRAAVFTLLGGVARAKAAGALVEVAALAPADTAAELSGAARRAFEDALAACLRGDPETPRTLVDRWSVVPGELRASALRRCAGCGTPASAELVAHVLASDPATSAVALAEIPQVCASATRRTRDALVREVRERLGGGALQGELARALGHLRDEASIPWLLDLLAAREAGLRDAARWALAEMTGLRFPADAAPWRTWYDDEARWLLGKGARAEKGLADPDPVHVLEWLREVAARRLGRDAWAGRVAALLTNTKPSVRLAACATLRDLGSRAPAEALADALLDSDEAVRREVHATLRAVTGLDHPPDVHVWRDALRGR